MIAMLMTLLIVMFATVIDLMTRRIPNYLTIPSIILGVTLQIYYLGFRGISTSFLGITLGVLLLLIPFALGGIGAGDVKLLATIGAINGYTFVFYAFLYSAISGGIIAVLYVLKRNQIYLALVSTVSLLQNPISFQSENDSTNSSSGITFPYGIAILAGTIVAYTLR